MEVETGMHMTTYIAEIHKALRDKYGFTPTSEQYGMPLFDNIPDGTYPMEIDGKVDHVAITDGKIDCCNFEAERALSMNHKPNTH